MRETRNRPLILVFLLLLLRRINRSKPPTRTKAELEQWGKGGILKGGKIVLRTNDLEYTTTQLNAS